MRTGILVLSVVLLAFAVTTDAAARSKPKEIVVVGSKVKEVIKEAGLRSDGELVQAVSDKVHELLDEAIVRAGTNERVQVLPHDLENGSCEHKAREIVVVGSKVKDVVRSAGFRAGDDLVTVVSEKVHAVLADAIRRCTSNGRSTVRPHDL